MRDFPFDPSVAAGLPALVTIQKGVFTIRITTWTHSVIVGDVIYEPWPGADLTGIQFPSDGTPANADVVVMSIPGSQIKPGDGVRGLLDNWPITIELFDPTHLNDGTFLLLSGTIGSVEENTRGMVTIAANGQLRLASEKSLVEHYSLTGRESLGDDRCKVPLCVAQDISAFDIQRGQTFVRPDFADGSTGLLLVSDAYGRVRTGVAGTVEDYANVYFECTVAGTTHATIAPTYDPTVGNLTIDGTATFIARNAWTRYARGSAIDAFNIQLTALPDARSTDGTWYPFGGLYVRSGNLSGSPVLPISAWDPDNFIVTLFLPILPDDLPTNTEFEIHSGCDLTNGMCQTRYADIANLRAENLVPPPEAVLGL